MILSLKSYGQGVLVLVDSVVMQSPSQDTYLQDIYLFENEFIARYNSYKNDTSYLYLVHSSRQTTEMFSKEGLIYTDRFCALYRSKSGYVLPRYLDNHLTILNSTEQKIIQNNTDNKAFTYKDKYWNFYYPFNNTWFSKRNDAYYSDSIAIFHCNNKFGMRDFKSLDRRVKAMKKRYRKKPVLMKYKVQEKEVASVFGTYPQIYKDSIEYYAANINSFSSIDRGNIYLSFQGDSKLYQYDFDGKLIDVGNFPAQYIRSHKLKLPSISEDAIFTSMLYNCYLDSYNEIYNFGSQLFRVYNLALDSAVLENYLDVDFTGCISPKVLSSLTDLQLSKPLFLQQIDFKGRKRADYRFPAEMVTFIGFDEASERYYFRKKNNYIAGEDAKVYVYERKLGYWGI